MHAIGELAEWSIVADSKSVVPLAVPGVRIPHSPQENFKDKANACSSLRSSKVPLSSSLLESKGELYCFSRQFPQGIVLSLKFSLTSTFGMAARQRRNPKSMGCILFLLPLVLAARQRRNPKSMGCILFLLPLVLAARQRRNPRAWGVFSLAPPLG